MADDDGESLMLLYVSPCADVATALKTTVAATAAVALLTTIPCNGSEEELVEKEEAAAMFPLETRILTF